MLAKGRTQIPTRGAADAADCAAVLFAADSFSFASSAAHSDLNGALSRFSPQASRSVVWMERTSIGKRALSKRTGTSTPRSAASRASPFTQRESTDEVLQTTTT